MSLRAFVSEWMGGYDRRLGLYNPETRQIAQQYTLHKYPEYLAQQLEAGTPGVYMTAQPMQDLDHAAIIERLFYDFDSKQDVTRALRDAEYFQQDLKEWYDAESILVYSGSKGYHVHLHLERPARAAGYRELERLYDELMRMTLNMKTGVSTFDPSVIDIKRLSRVPFSVHQGSGQLCVPVSMKTGAPRPYRPEPGFRDHLTRHGLPSYVVEAALKNVRRAGTAPKPRGMRRRRGVRPCMEAVLEAGSVHEGPHLMRVAAVAELHAEGVPQEDIVDRFRDKDGFNERKTRYLVKQGIEKGYRPFRCATIQRLGGCLGQGCPIYRGPPTPDQAQEVTAR